jgi:hypothetical protein
MSRCSHGSRPESIQPDLAPGVAPFVTIGRAALGAFSFSTRAQQRSADGIIHLRAAHRSFYVKISKSSTITDELAEAETQVADLVQQIAVAKTDLERAEANATASALSGNGLDEAVTIASKAQLMLRALENAKAETDAKIVALRKQHAEKESILTRQAAQPLMYAMADELDGIEVEVLPLLTRYSDLVSKGDDVLQFHCGIGAIAGINAMVDAVRGPMKMLAGQLRGSADALLVNDEPEYRLATAKRALAAAAALQ